MKGKNEKSEKAEAKGKMKFKQGGNIPCGTSGKARGMGAATKGGKFKDL